MEKCMFLIFGNHPKAVSIKQRALKIIKFLKENNDWTDLDQIQKHLNIDRKESPSKFYKPLSAMKQWKLLDSKRRVTGGRGKHVIYTTYYKLTPDRFLSYIKDTLYAVCQTELKMYK